MSPKTTRLDGPTPTGPAELGASRLSASRRIATVGLLALSLMIPFGATSAPEVQQLIAAAQSQTETIGADLGEMDVALGAIPDALRSEIRDAIDSTRAATEEARAALATATTDETGTAAVVLADAQIALDAAFAQVRYVTDLASAQGSEVSDPLIRLQEHLGALRGETDRATV